EEVFEALVTEEGRDRWLGEPDRQIHVESADPPHRLVWWWVSDDQPATRGDFRIVALPPGDGARLSRVPGTQSPPSFPPPTPGLPAPQAGARFGAGVRVTHAQLASVFAALADPTRRGVVQALLSGESTSVPALSERLPMSRQAVAKHLATLEQAGLLERLPAG